MIVISKLMKHFIEGQVSIEGFADRLKVSRQTVYNIMKGDAISNELMSKLVEETGLSLDEAFEVKE